MGEIWVRFSVARGFSCCATEFCVLLQNSAVPQKWRLGTECHRSRPVYQVELAVVLMDCWTYWWWLKPSTKVVQIYLPEHPTETARPKGPQCEAQRAKKSRPKPELGVGFFQLWGLGKCCKPQLPKDFFCNFLALKTVSPETKRRINEQIKKCTNEPKHDPFVPKN